MFLIDVYLSQDITTLNHYCLFPPETVNKGYCSTKSIGQRQAVSWKLF